MIVDKVFFKKNGYYIVRNVFTENEIKSFRSLAYETLEQDKKNNLVTNVATNIKNVYYPLGDLLGKPIKKLLLSDKVLEIAAEILGETPIYFRDSTYQIGVGDRGFHRDNVDRIANVGQDWDGEYGIIRIGVYMQDHDKYSGGLKVIKGSNNGKSTKKIFVDSKAGDVVIWNLRTLHSGNAARLKLFPNLVLGYRLENALPKFLFKDSQQERISCFMSFAKEGVHLNRYLKEYMQVKMINHIKNSPPLMTNFETSNPNVIIQEVNEK